jgi:hypothetical protein
MLARQTAFEFEPPRASRPVHTVPRALERSVPTPAACPAAHLDPEAERARTTSLLERRLCELLGSEVSLTLTDNGRSMLSVRRRHEVAYVRLHHMFLAADEVTLRAIASYLRGQQGASLSHLRQFVAQHRTLIRRAPARARQVRAAGHHHDLRAIFDHLNARYFDGLVEARVSWGRMGKPIGRRRRRRVIKLGSYRHRDALVSVHPVLDADWVPDFFVEYIVYHEMVHHVVAVPSKDGRRELHGPEFRAREQQFEHYAKALRWERDNHDLLQTS